MVSLANVGGASHGPSDASKACPPPLTLSHGLRGVPCEEGRRQFWEPGGVDGGHLPAPVLRLRRVFVWSNEGSKHGAQKLCASLSFKKLFASLTEINGAAGAVSGQPCTNFFMVVGVDGG